MMIYECENCGKEMKKDEVIFIIYQDTVSGIACSEMCADILYLKLTLTPIDELRI
jgi:hypothetical protein